MGGVDFTNLFITLKGESFSTIEAAKGAGSVTGSATDERDYPRDRNRRQQADQGSCLARRPDRNTGETLDRPAVFLSGDPPGLAAVPLG